MGGGMGGGMMGMGGMGMGGMGMGGMGAGGQQQQTLQDRKDDLLDLIQETIYPLSWYDNGGEGTIRFYEDKKLVVSQTPEIHREIDRLLRNLRKALGHQVAIEARFILVGENFLEDIGVDIDFRHPPLFETQTIPDPNGGGGMVTQLVPTGNFFATQDSSDQSRANATAVAGSLGDIGSSIELGWQGWLLDGLQTDVLIRATQAHQDSKTLVAPKATVLSGEMASFGSARLVPYTMQPVQTTTDRFGNIVTGGSIASATYPSRDYVPSGTILSVGPTITPDKKHVLLHVSTVLNELLAFRTLETDQLNSAGDVVTTTEDLPETEISVIQTRVSVPDGGTLLIGGLKRTAQNTKEAGVPILSKIPVIGRLFSNKSDVRDQRILLIMIKPTIILEEETDAEALAALE
jgi:general secretion pathway protein D